MSYNKLKYKLNAYVYSKCGINKSVNRLYDNLKQIKESCACAKKKDKHRCDDCDCRHNGCNLPCVNGKCRSNCTDCGVGNRKNR